MKKIALALIKGYKILISPLLGRNCRFYPTCSEYMHEAIQKYGLFKGISLGTRRLLKCHPFHAGGVDHVP
jgi:putative membrane protein insertion efficiency factor